MKKNENEEQDDYNEEILIRLEKVEEEILENEKKFAMIYNILKNKKNSKNT